MHVCLPDHRVLCSASVRVKHSHNVILHESKPFIVFAPARDLVINDALNANDEDVRHVSGVRDIRQQPVSQIDLGVWLDATHVPAADGHLDVVYRREFLLH